MKGVKIQAIYELETRKLNLTLLNCLLSKCHRCGRLIDEDSVCFIHLINAGNLKIAANHMTN